MSSVRIHWLANPAFNLLVPYLNALVIGLSDNGYRAVDEHR